jgi:secreted trypsin-like serine protease
MNIQLYCNVTITGYPANFPGHVKPRAKGRLVGAFEDNIENVPYVVSLQWNGYHFCVGTVLNAKTILTSAHCVK